MAEARTPDGLLYKSCPECDWDAASSQHSDLKRAYDRHRQTHRAADEAEERAEREDS